MSSLLALLLAFAPQEPAEAVVAAPPPRDLAALLGRAADGARFAELLAHVRRYRLQVLLTEPVTAADGALQLRRSALGDPRQYFYPASSVKLGAAIAVQLELQRLQRQREVEFGTDLRWRFAARFAGDVESPWLGVDDDLRAMLEVSDNAAFNHCFELLGPARLNAAMWDAGLRSVRLWHRLSEARSTAENLATRAVSLRWTDGELQVPARNGDRPRLPGDLAFDNAAFTDLDVGESWVRAGPDDVVHAPMSFAQKNAVALRDLQDLLIALVAPELSTGGRGFPELTAEARARLCAWITLAPRGAADAGNPVAAGTARAVPPAALRVRGKSGRAYGFSIENTAITDLRSGRSWFLAAALYTNPDGVLNDDRYAYAEVADPFLSALAEALARAVLADDRAGR